MGCYCNQDQGAGYTYSDEYGSCGHCLWIDKPHTFEGSIDDDCTLCGYSIYMDWHTNGFSQTEIGDKINE